MMPSPPRARPVFFACLRIALASGLLLAVIDVGRAVAQASTPVPLFALVRALQAALGFYGVAALVAGAVEGLVIAGIATTVPLDVGNWIRGVRADRERDRAQAAGLLATAAALALMVPLVFFYFFFVAAEMSARRNGALSTAIVAAGLVPLLAVGWPLLYQLARRAVLVLPPPRVLVLLGLILAIVALALVGAVASVEWRVIDFGPPLAIALFFGLQAAHALVWYRGRGARLRERVRPAMRSLFVGSAAAVALLSLAVTWLRFGDEPRSLALVGEETMGAKVLLRAARKLADHDGDGYAGRLGGGDCDDRNPRVFPGAEEIRGNGIDEDCDGADAPAAVARHVDEKSQQAANYVWNGNLLVITVDTLRADRFNPKVMPRVSAFAKDAVSFTHAYAQAPNTPRSFPSFLISRFPSEIKWHRMEAQFSPTLDVPANTTLFQAIHALGFFNTGVFSHFYLAPRIGCNRGFDEWDNEGALSVRESNTDVSSPRITEKVLAKLKELKATGRPRWALWTHLPDAHSRYMDHAEYPSHASGIDGLQEKYDGEVSFVDQHVGMILDQLKASGLDENTAVVIFADHGEAFGEHKFGGERIFFHGQTLYDEILHVPLLFRVPGIKPRTVDAPVMLLDLGPTVVDLVKAKRPESFHGRSLLPALLGETIAEEPVYAELLPAPDWKHRGRAIMIGGWKLIQKLSENTVELYDLKKDPGEQQNLAPSDPARTSEMQRKMAAFVVEEEKG
jgi:arylsulfatase A-like enzyme